ncbi:hypothetical protein [Micromonospora sp. NPDC047738]
MDGEAGGRAGPPMVVAVMNAVPDSPPASAASLLVEQRLVVAFPCRAIDN